MSDARADVRRLRVASLHLRGLTPLEIQTALRQSGVVGEDGRAYDLETICEDLAFLRQVWTTEVRIQPTEHKARVLAELREARRAAWASGDVEQVFKGLKQESELFRLAALLDF
jgi:hypothetical protein